MNPLKRIPKKLVVSIGLATALVTPAVMSQTGAVSAASTRLKVVAPSSYDRWAGVADQWTRNFVISGNSTDVVTAGISIGTANSRDSVSVFSTNNLTLSYGFSSWRNMKSIAFSGTVADINKGLASVRLNTVSAGKVEMRVFVTRSESNMAFQPSNGHFYEYVSNRGITWTAAKAAAESRTLRGVTGYLATVTDSRENAFVSQSIPNARNVWLGGTDSGKEGVWKWATGPEAGKTFMTMTCATKTGDDACNGANVLKTPGSSSVQYSDLATGDYASKKYTAWAFNEPNNWGTTGEHYVATNWQGTSGEWNDLADNTSQINGYVVEYSGKLGAPAPQVYSAKTIISKVPVRYTPLNVRVTGKVGASKRGLAWSKHVAAKPAQTLVRAMPSGRSVCRTTTSSCVDRSPAKGDRYYLVSFLYATRPSVTTTQKAFTTRINISR